MKIRRNTKSRRRGTVTSLTAVSMSVLIGFMALSVDLGMLYNVRAELQRGADAAALAGAMELATDARIRGGTEWASALMSARTMASSYGSANTVHKQNPTVDLNAINDQSGDILLGHLPNPDDLDSPILFPADSSKFNTVLVRVHRNDVRNGPIPLWFAQVFGIESTSLEAMAAATLDERVVGFRITERSGNPLLLPFALHKDAWNNLLAKGEGTTDAFSYNEATGVISSGSDDIHELNLYPGGGTANKGNGGGSGGGQFPQLGPGNYGTVDIGSPNNSTADLARQILYGPNQSDLNHLGGELKLNENGYVLLNGDTGLSAGVKDELEAIKGQPRVIPIFDQVTGNGNNAMFRIIGFAGIRILDVQLTGSMSSKRVIIQPAAVVDPTAVTSTQGNASYVYAPVRLTR